MDWLGHARLLLADAEQRHPVLDGGSVGDERFGEHTRYFRLNLIHQLHSFDDAERLSLLDRITDPDEGRSAGRRSFIESADDGRLYDEQIGLCRFGNCGGGRLRFATGCGRSRRWSAY